MPCGCVEVCNCLITDTATISVAGAGTAVSPYQLSVIIDDEGGLEAGVDGLAILLDPASTAPVSIGPDGLLIDCCAASVTDSATIDFSILAGAITGDVIVDPDDGLENNAAGVGIKVDPASTATVTTSVDGLRVDAVASAPDPPDNVVFTVSGTFDKDTYPGLVAVKVRTVGAGGGSGGTAATGAGQNACSGGGGGGGYCEEILLASALSGAGETVTVGTGGTAGAAGNNNGGTGGASSFGAFHTASGGLGGVGGPAAAAAAASNGGDGGAAANGDINVPGGHGHPGLVVAGTRIRHNGGGITPLGMGAQVPNTQNGVVGQAYGSGASGSSQLASLGALAGAVGADGAVFVELVF